jgi:hypothetical protein
MASLGGTNGGGSAFFRQKGSGVLFSIFDSGFVICTLPLSASNAPSSSLPFRLQMQNKYCKLLSRSKRIRIWNLNQAERRENSRKAPLPLHSSSTQTL